MQRQINTIQQVAYLVICEVNQCAVIFSGLICHSESLLLVGWIIKGLPAVMRQCSPPLLFFMALLF